MKKYILVPFKQFQQMGMNNHSRPPVNTDAKDPAVTKPNEQSISAGGGGLKAGEQEISPFSAVADRSKAGDKVRTPPVRSTSQEKPTGEKNAPDLLTEKKRKTPIISKRRKFLVKKNDIHQAKSKPFLQGSKSNGYRPTIKPTPTTKDDDPMPASTSKFWIRT